MSNPKICPTCGQHLPVTLVDVPNRIPKATRAATLPFERPALDLRDAILDAIWELLQPAIGRAVRVTDWKAANRRAALAMAQAHITPVAAVAGWKRASDRMGSPVRSVSVVHREIQQAYCERAAQG